MTIKELIHIELDSLNETELKDIYHLVKEYTQSKSKINKPSLMSKLSQIQIDAPDDFSLNFDLYTNGENQTNLLKEIDL